ncbi:MAG: alpha/beta hydrolase [Gemmatimonadales bacterium]
MSLWHPYSLEGTGQPGQITLLVRRGVRSPELRNRRDILVALPPGYDDAGERYPVVYMHDGQNLFDPATSANGDWGLVGTLAAEALAGRPAIVVGIANIGPRRPYEYSPFRDMFHGGGGGDRYLGYVVSTVKPLIDAGFRTRPGPESTAFAGASLGGLISLYGLYRMPTVFGAAAALSPAIWFADRAILDFVRPRAGLEARLYADAGTAEGGEVVADVERLRDVLLAAGRRDGSDFRITIAEGDGHDEAAWGRRFRHALPFLLGSEQEDRGE